MKRQEEEMLDLWHQIHRDLHGHFKEAFKTEEIPMGAMMVMHRVASEPGITLSELARRCGIAKSHASGIVEAMSRRGYVEKRSDPSDQRLLRLYLTPAAREKAAWMRGMIHEMWAGVTASMSEAEKEDLLKGLRVLHGALQRAKKVAEE